MLSRLSHKALPFITLLLTFTVNKIKYNTIIKNKANTILKLGHGWLIVSHPYLLLRHFCQSDSLLINHTQICPAYAPAASLTQVTTRSKHPPSGSFQETLDDYQTDFHV